MFAVENTIWKQKLVKHSDILFMFVISWCWTFTLCMCQKGYRSNWGLWFRPSMGFPLADCKASPVDETVAFNGSGRSSDALILAKHEPLNHWMVFEHQVDPAKCQYVDFFHFGVNTSVFAKYNPNIPRLSMALFFTCNCNIRVMVCNILYVPFSFGL